MSTQWRAVLTRKTCFILFCFKLPEERIHILRVQGAPRLANSCSHRNLFFPLLPLLDYPEIALKGEAFQFVDIRSGSAFYSPYIPHVEFGVNIILWPVKTLCSYMPAFIIPAPGGRGVEMGGLTVVRDSTCLARMEIWVASQNPCKQSVVTALTPGHQSSYVGVWWNKRITGVSRLSV